MKKIQKPVTDDYLDPSLFLGESVARRVVSDQRSFYKKYGKEPTTTINFGAPGHSRGLIQLLTDSGYEFYKFSPSGNTKKSLPEAPFKWIGFDASSIIVQTRTGNVGSVSFSDDELIGSFNNSSRDLPQYKGDLNNLSAIQVRSINTLKQLIFTFEHKYYTAEKLLSLAAVSGVMVYPAKKMARAMEGILLFKVNVSDTGQVVRKKVNESYSRILKALAIIEKEIDALVFTAGNSIKKSSAGEYPFLIVNHHSFVVDTIAEFEMQINEPVISDEGSLPVIVLNEKGDRIPSQCEKTETSGSGDLIRKVVFRTTVPAGSMTRYSCFFDDISPIPVQPEPEPDLVFKTVISTLVIDRMTGFPSSFEFDGKQLLGDGSMNFYLTGENTDPVLSSLSGPVRLSETGPVRTIVESLFTCGSSSIQVRYLIPRNDPYFDIEISVSRVESDKTLKWSIPVGYNMNCIGRVISGINCCKHRKREFLFRDWLGMKNFEGDFSLSLCAAGAYSYDIDGNTVRLSLPQTTDKFRFRFLSGKTDDVIDRSFNNSDLFNNPLITRQVYTKGEAGQTFSGIRISDPKINLQAVKLNENGDLVLRILNPGRTASNFRIEVPSLGFSEDLEIGSKKLKTVIIEKRSGRFVETDLTERIKS